MKIKEVQTWDFPGCPVIETLLIHCRGTGSISGQAANILYAALCHQN